MATSASHGHAKHPRLEELEEGELAGGHALEADGRLVPDTYAVVGAAAAPWVSSRSYTRR